MVKRSKLAKRAGMIAAIAVMTASMSAVTAYAADLTPGNANTQYVGPGTVTTMTIDGNKQSLQTPTASDRCSLKYFGVDKYKQNEEDVKIYAYHIIEGNYNQYGFLGWTETKDAADLVKFNSFQKTTDNVVQVVVEDNDKNSPTYNRKTVITSDNITDLSRQLLSADLTTKFTDKVELTWSNENNCYMTKNAKAGTYLVLVVKEDRGVIYNPVIISNDYADANVARSLSNYVDGDGNEGTSLHDNEAFNAKDFPYESGIELDNSKFVAYGSVNPKDVKNSLVTGDNKDLAPQAQTDYMKSHETVVYYKDTTKNGNVYALYNKHNAGSADTMDEKNIETMALKGKAYAKKSSVILEKNIVNASVPKSYTNDIATGSKLGYSKYDDVSEGDTVQYDILTQIPYYADGYFKDEKKFLFKVTDTQHDGLAAVTKDNIKVYVADSNNTDAQNIGADIKKDDKAVLEGDAYEITIKDNTFSVSFKQDYVLANPGKMVLVSYTTTVTDKAAKGLNGNPNEVFLEYTTLPTTPDNDNKPSRGYKFDFAIQYTFSPTAFKLAEDGTVTVVEGKNVVTVEDQADIAKSESVDLPLAGARFKLQRVGTHYSDNAYVADGVDIAKDTTKWKAETAALEEDPKTSWDGYQTWFLTSDEKGVITFDSAVDGIDEGIYTLEEIEAPKDYTINDKIYVINVDPKFDENAQRFIGTDVKIGAANLDTEGNITNYDIDGSTFVTGTNYDYDEYGKLLQSYTYDEWASNLIDSYSGKVEDLKPATAEQDSLATGKHTTLVSYKANAETGEDEKIAETDLVGIINTKLTRLPSTGGVGTIGFTVGGFALMGASAYIIAKKKRENDNK